MHPYSSRTVGVTTASRWPRRTGSAAQVPLLVGPAVAGPKNDLGAIGGGGTVRVQAQPGLDAGDGAVSVEIPLLVGLPVAVPDDDIGAVAGALAVRVQALVAVHLQLLTRGVRPPLVRV